jgi:hypothetical protein
LIRRVEVEQSPFRDRAREYWMEYPALVRPFAGLHVSLGAAITAWTRVEWPAGDAVVRDNLTPPAGRTLLVGVDLNPFSSRTTRRE